jgi:hypothetical protein
MRAISKMYLCMCTLKKKKKKTNNIHTWSEAEEKPSSKPFFCVWSMT